MKDSFLEEKHKKEFGATLMTSRFVTANTIAILIAITFTATYVLYAHNIEFSDLAEWKGFKAFFGVGGTFALLVSALIAFRLLGPLQRAVFFALSSVFAPTLLLFSVDVSNPVAFEALAIVYIVFVVDAAYSNRSSVETEPLWHKQAVIWIFRITLPLLLIALFFAYADGSITDGGKFPVLARLEVMGLNQGIEIGLGSIIFFSMILATLIWLGGPRSRKTFVVHGMLISFFLFAASKSPTIYPAVWAVIGLISIFVFFCVYEASHHKNIDALTGLGNRESLKYHQDTTEPTGVAVFDLDKFKAINDTYGHDGGDVVLFNAGKILASIPPHAGVAFRIGGEEFVVLLYGSDNVNLDTCESLRMQIESVSHHVMLNEKPVEIQVTASIGVRNLAENESYEHAFKYADQALYNAKNSGRNKVVEATKKQEPLEDDNRESA